MGSRFTFKMAAFWDSATQYVTIVKECYWISLPIEGKEGLYDCCDCKRSAHWQPSVNRTVTDWTLQLLSFVGQYIFCVRVESHLNQQKSLTQLTHQPLFESLTGSGRFKLFCFCLDLFRLRRLSNPVLGLSVVWAMLLLICIKVQLSILKCKSTRMLIFLS